MTTDGDCHHGGHVVSDPARPLGLYDNVPARSADREMVRLLMPVFGKVCQDAGPSWWSATGKTTTCACWSSTCKMPVSALVNSLKKECWSGGSVGGPVCARREHLWCPS